MRSRVRKHLIPDRVSSRVLLLRPRQSPDCAMRPQNAAYLVEASPRIWQVKEDEGCDHDVEPVVRELETLRISQGQRPLVASPGQLQHPFGAVDARDHCSWRCPLDCGQERTRTG